MKITKEYTLPDDNYEWNVDKQAHNLLEGLQTLCGGYALSSDSEYSFRALMKYDTHAQIANAFSADKDVSEHEKELIEDVVYFTCSLLNDNFHEVLRNCDVNLSIDE